MVAHRASGTLQAHLGLEVGGEYLLNVSFLFLIRSQNPKRSLVSDPEAVKIQAWHGAPQCADAAARGALGRWIIQAWWRVKLTSCSIGGGPLWRTLHWEGVNGSRDGRPGPHVAHPSALLPSAQCRPHHPGLLEVPPLHFPGFIKGYYRVTANQPDPRTLRS